MNSNPWGNDPHAKAARRSTGTLRREVRRLLINLAFAVLVFLLVMAGYRYVLLPQVLTIVNKQAPTDDQRAAPPGR